MKDVTSIPGQDIHFDHNLVVAEVDIEKLGRENREMRMLILEKFRNKEVNRIYVEKF